MLDVIEKQSFWVARCDWGFQPNDKIHAHVHLETPTQKYFLEMPEFKKWFFDLWKNEDLQTTCEDENYSLNDGFSKLGFDNLNEFLMLDESSLW